jgi:hypothetical protein
MTRTIAFVWLRALRSSSSRLRDCVEALRTLRAPEPCLEVLHDIRRRIDLAALVAWALVVGEPA